MCMKMRKEDWKMAFVSKAFFYFNTLQAVDVFEGNGIVNGESN